MITHSRSPRNLVQSPAGKGPQRKGAFKGLTLGQVGVSNEFESTLCKHLYAYWQERRGAHPYPTWDDIDLIKIYDLAPRVLVKDVVDNGLEFRNRFWGTDLTYILGLDATGLLIRDYAQPDRLSHALDMYRLAMRSDLPVRKRGKIKVNGREDAAFEAILLPLSAEDRTAIGQIMALYDFDI